MNHSYSLLLLISPSLYQSCPTTSLQTPTLILSILFSSQEVSSLLLSSIYLSTEMGDWDYQSFLVGFLPLSSVAATLAVVLRICARRIQKLRLELNDYVILLGLVGKLSRLVTFAS